MHSFSAIDQIYDGLAATKRCDKGSFHRICCPTKAMPKNCEWLGAPDRNAFGCNAVCGSSQFELAQDRSINREGEAPCYAGYRSLCCDSTEILDQCHWTDCDWTSDTNGNCGSDEVSVATRYDQDDGDRCKQQTGLGQGGSGGPTTHYHFRSFCCHKQDPLENCKWSNDPTGPALTDGLIRGITALTCIIRGCKEEELAITDVAVPSTRFDLEQSMGANVCEVWVIPPSTPSIGYQLCCDPPSRFTDDWPVNPAWLWAGAHTDEDDDVSWQWYNNFGNNNKDTRPADLEEDPGDDPYGFVMLDGPPGSIAKQFDRQFTVMTGQEPVGVKPRSFVTTDKTSSGRDVRTCRRDARDTIIKLPAHVGQGPWARVVPPKIIDSYVYVGAQPEMYAGITIRGDAQLSYQSEVKKLIQTIAYPGLSIKGIATVGPSLDIYGRIEGRITASGQLKVGAKYTFDAVEMYLPNDEGTRDRASDKLQSFDRNEQGIAPVFQADVKADVDVHLRITPELNCGIKVGGNIGPLKDPFIDGHVSAFVNTSLHFAAHVTGATDGQSSDWEYGYSVELLWRIGLTAVAQLYNYKRWHNSERDITRHTPVVRGSLVPRGLAKRAIGDCRLKIPLLFCEFPIWFWEGHTGLLSNIETNVEYFNNADDPRGSDPDTDTFQSRNSNSWLVKGSWRGGGDPGRQRLSQYDTDQPKSLSGQNADVSKTAGNQRLKYFSCDIDFDGAPHGKRNSMEPIGYFGDGAIYGVKRSANYHETDVKIPVQEIQLPDIRQAFPLS
ncbi:hypothetical protein GGS20DRAFT_582126 [Poronia punctata]|nr:hypothetical protein GGS20DRAFT_582126 [Poronia punctata]